MDALLGGAWPPQLPCPLLLLPPSPRDVNPHFFAFFVLSKLFSKRFLYIACAP